MQQFRSPTTEFPADRMRALYISDAEVDGLLRAPPSMDGGRLSQLGTQLPRLMEIFGLDALDEEIFLICLAPELDLRYERLYGYLQDDMTRRRPSVDLVLRLLDRDCADVRRALGPAGRLASLGLIAHMEDDNTRPNSFLTTLLRVDPRISEYLLGLDGLDRRLEDWASLVEPASAESAGQPESKRLVAQFPSAGDWSTPGPIVYLRGADPAWGLVLVRQWANAVGARVLVADLRETTNSESLVAVTREALLQDAVLVLRGVSPTGEHGDAVPAAVQRVLEAFPRLTFLIGASRWEPARYWSDRPTFTVELSTPSATTRSQLWSAHLDHRFPPTAAHELGSRYRLIDDADLRAVVKGAAARAAINGCERVVLGDLLEVARTLASPELGGLAQHLEPRYAWPDLVLPADGIGRLRELCARFRHRATVYETWGYADSGARRRGVTALFVGLPGTGKTMAAEIVAADLVYDLYRVDLSAIVSKYIGETEKNLEAIFRAAEQGEVVLLFDEADALFGKRSEVRDAHDRYANIEVAYLLQRLETYSGVAILTSNLSGNLDEAFLRRLDVVVEFPFPQEAERWEIWKRSLPDAAPRADDVDLAELARIFKLTGGHIRNSALAAAFLAADEGEPISRRHLLHAIRREYEKMGKLVN
ncbi:MAG: ATP-binding protein [Chloroflexi bacterium]|nr:ATP-binding protein [Chloroflexota bacterium]